jgi:hypothetical protein
VAARHLQAEVPLLAPRCPPHTCKFAFALGMRLEQHLLSLLSRSPPFLDLHSFCISFCVPTPSTFVSLLFAAGFAPAKGAEFRLLLVL